LLAERLIGATDWLGDDPGTRDLRIGYFGASIGTGAALVAAAERAAQVGAIVSRGGRPDLAGEALSLMKAPTLLIVAGEDAPVIGVNLGPRSTEGAGTDRDRPRRDTPVRRAGHARRSPISPGCGSAGTWRRDSIARSGGRLEAKEKRYGTTDVGETKASVERSNGRLVAPRSQPHASDRPGIRGVW
jgi:hypothetical protein